MALRTIITKEDPFLRRKAREVAQIDDRILTILQDMAETMYEANGVGLAAPQIGQSIRLVVIDVPLEEDERTGPIVLINPCIVEKEGKQVFNEGCLSLPDFSCDVERAAKVKVEALDRDGRPFTTEAEGLLAICLQHELDHLDGKLAVDYISPLKRALYRKRREKETN